MVGSLLNCMINIDAIDQGTEYLAEAMRPYLERASAYLSRDYGGLMEHLWIDLEMSPGRADIRPARPFRFQHPAPGRPTCWCSGSSAVDRPSDEASKTRLSHFAKAEPRVLASAAMSYENSSVRRLGYLLDRAGHVRQAKALESFVKKAKSFVPLDPAVKPLIESLVGSYEKDVKWRLVLTEPVEIDFGFRMLSYRLGARRRRGLICDRSNKT